MSWKLDLAVNRIFKALKRNKNNIFSEDIEALKTISQSINSNREKMVVDNILFEFHFSRFYSVFFKQCKCNSNINNFLIIN